MEDSRFGASGQFVDHEHGHRTSGAVCDIRQLLDRAVYGKGFPCRTGLQTELALRTATGISGIVYGPGDAHGCAVPKRTVTQSACPGRDERVVRRPRLPS